MSLPLRPRLRPASAVLLLLLCCGAEPAAAQPPAGVPPPVPAPAATPAPAGETPTEVQTVGRISVVGNATTDSARIVRTFEVASGSRYSPDAIKRGLRKLFALGLFGDAWVESVPRGTVADLVIHVVERPRIAKIEFSGNRKREANELERKLLIHPGETYSPTVVQTQVDSLLRYYHEEGYARAAIEAVVDSSAGAGRVGLRFVVREGERVRIGVVHFVGATAFPEGKLRKQMKTRAKNFFGGGEVKEENVDEDKEKLETFYRSHGYRDMRVSGRELQPTRDPRRLALVVTVEEGHPYRMGGVSWSGNRVLGTAQLTRLWTGKSGERYDLSKIERTQGLAYAEYAENGYLYLSIEPRESVRDSVVDVQFAITEGQPSHVRWVNISGNHNTREKVIRREIDLHEGDRFKRSALSRTRDDLFRLGLFEDVQVDFTPAESTDVDLQLKVKEKQVGTASAGAGYTNEAGFTGFLELGHNNVLGNGQSLSLHLERGAKTSDYELSFTEPWFRDTPTLLGFSAFNTWRERDIYRERRVGGSGRIGRPLPWPDYSRGSFSYQLEDVTIDKIGSVATLEDTIALSGISLGRPVRTSSIEVNFLRNSTDNPFYPKRGTRLLLDDELAGGPFGGSVNFHKHRIEGRIYLPSVIKGITTMLRARVGLLGEYGDQNLEVPTYERFRLGGGTTLDPLRGYDDYQVVPGKFIRSVPLRHFLRTDTLSTSPLTTQDVYDTTYTRVRYPGGRFMVTYTVEQQFPIVHPLHGVLFFDAGNTWDLPREIRPFDLKVGAGAGIRLEIPLLGNIGFDYGYGFNRDDGARFVGHFLIGNINF